MTVHAPDPPSALASERAAGARRTAGTGGDRSSRFVPLARATRGGVTESWHAGAVAVVTPDGRLVARAGDPETATFLRSTAKPFQAMALLAAGGERAYDLSDADVALTCASHGGYPQHAERAAALLAREGLTVDDLACGVHPPMDEAAAEALRRRGEEPTPLHNNCSGKHAGMLLACRRLGLPIEGYEAPDHPLQRGIRDRLVRFLGLESGETAGDLTVGIDGCSVPTYCVSLRAAARAYAALADPEAADRTDRLDEEDRRVAHRVVEAMAAAPEMVAGPGRFTTRLIAATGGRVIGKEGAEGFYAVAVRGPAAFGVALKIADGGDRCRDGVVLSLLRTLGALSAEELSRLDEFARPARRNHRGLVVGWLEPDVELTAPRGEEAT